MLFGVYKDLFENDIFKSSLCESSIIIIECISYPFSACQYVHGHIADILQCYREKYDNTVSVSSSCIFVLDSINKLYEYFFFWLLRTQVRSCVT